MLFAHYFQRISNCCQIALDCSVLASLRKIRIMYQFILQLRLQCVPREREKNMCVREREKKERKPKRWKSCCWNMCSSELFSCRWIPVYYRHKRFPCITQCVKFNRLRVLIKSAHTFRKNLPLLFFCARSLQNIVDFRFDEWHGIACNLNVSM